MSAISSQKYCKHDNWIKTGGGTQEREASQTCKRKQQTLIILQDWESRITAILWREGKDVWMEGQAFWADWPLGDEKKTLLTHIERDVCLGDHYRLHFAHRSRFCIICFFGFVRRSLESGVAHIWHSKHAALYWYWHWKWWVGGRLK